MAPRSTGRNIYLLQGEVAITSACGGDELSEVRGKFNIKIDGPAVFYPHSRIVVVKREDKRKFFNL